MRNLKEMFRRPVVVISLFVPGILFLVLPFYRPENVPFIFLFFGRLHPLILHFPIVLIILLLLFEVGRYFHIVKVTDRVIIILLIAAALSAFISVGAGFFLFASGDYSGNLMDLHFWAGSIAGASIFTSMALFILHWSTSKFYYAYLTMLLLSNIVVAYTSHLGGSITHGQDYLTEHLELLFIEPPKKEIKTEDEMLVYEDMIAPIFEAKCLSCHNSEKAKGNLSMISYKKLLKGGESELPSLTPKSSEKSELYNRVTLPLDHKDHMPPEGKTPLSKNEISVLQYWIESGASENLKVQKIKSDQKIRDAVESILPQLKRYQRNSYIAANKLKTLEANLQDLSHKLSVTIKRDSLSEENYFTIAMRFPPATFTNDEFGELSPYFEVFSKASLVSSGIDDAGLYYIGQMKNLEALYLQKTSLDGSGVVYLKKLTKLRVLNLSFTKVDDKAAIDLLQIPNLEHVYLYRTNTSKQVIEALQKNRPALKILIQEGPYF